MVIVFCQSASTRRLLASLNVIKPFRGGNGLVWKSCNFAASKSQTNKFLEKIGCYQTFASKLAGLYVASILVK